MRLLDHPIATESVLAREEEADGNQRGVFFQKPLSRSWALAVSEIHVLHMSAVNGEEGIFWHDVMCTLLLFL